MGIDRKELTIASAILAKAGIADCDAAMLSPLTLAYIGDCVYELIVRTIVIGRAEHTVNTLHKHTCKYVNAASQKALLGILSEKLTESEASVVRRGRSGYWYLTGQEERMLALLTEAIRVYDAQQEEES